MGGGGRLVTMRSAMGMGMGMGMAWMDSGGSCARSHDLGGAGPRPIGCCATRPLTWCRASETLAYALAWRPRIAWVRTPRGYGRAILSFCMGIFCFLFSSTI